MNFAKKVLFAVIILMTINTPFAVAHNSIVASSPTESETYPSRPTEITLEYSKYINPSTASFLLYNSEGKAIPFSGKEKYNGNVVKLVPPSLDQGTYALVWRSTGYDGHEAVGQITFNVIAPSPVFVNPELSTKNITLIQVSKGFWYLGLVILIGFLLRQRNEGVRFLNRFKILGIFLLGTLIGKFVLVINEVSDGSFSETAGRILSNQPTGAGWILQTIAIALLFVKVNTKVLSLSVLLSIVGSVLTGHMAGSWLNVIITVTHLCSILVWTGSVFYLLVELKSGRGIEAVKKLRTIIYSVVPLAVLSGLLLFISRSGLLTPYAVFDALQVHPYTQIIALKFLIVIILVIPTALIGKKLWSKGRGRSASIFEFTALVGILFLGATLSAQQPDLGRNDTSKVADSLFSVPANYRECVSGPSYNACVERWFMSQVSTEGVEKTLQTLNDASREDAGVRNNCHGTVHGIGREAYRVLGDIEKAYSLGSGTCGAGYYHGVLEGYSRVSTDEDFIEKMPVICEKFTGAMREFCDHGVGHAVILRTNGDAERGREFCEVLEFDKNRFVRCLSGLYMEWGLRYRDAGQAANNDPKAMAGMPYPRVDYALDLCKKLETTGSSYEELFVCYEGAFFGLQTKMFMGLDIMREAVTYCNSQEGLTSEACFGGFGGEVYQWVGKEYEDGFVLCNLATKEADRKICIQGYVNGWLFRERNLALAESLCKDFVRKEDLGICYLTIESYKKRAEGFKETDLIDENGDIVVFEDEKVSLIP
jgi:methionine-rich copper-binding protein CopC